MYTIFNKLCYKYNNTNDGVMGTRPGGWCMSVNTTSKSCIIIIMYTTVNFINTYYISPIHLVQKGFPINNRNGE